MKENEVKLLRDLFIKFMTIDSNHTDRRKKDYNQAIFFKQFNGNEHIQVFNGTTMEMVLSKFDKAVKEVNRRPSAKE